MVFLVSQLFGPVRVILVSFSETQKVLNVQQFDKRRSNVPLMFLRLKEAKLLHAEPEAQFGRHL